MQLIFGKDVAEKLQERYTVLELETLEVEGKMLEVFCVVPAEKIALTEITTIEHSTKLHNEFVNALKRKDYKICQDLSVHLIGRFGGEVDSFYEEILKRISSI
jgi:hypothetical protein